MDSLFKKLTDYAQNGRIPMHMPGHKRNCGVFTVENAVKIDITEIDGFDDYHYPEDVILESMENASRVYGSRETYYLVNGSTCGILAAVSAAVDMGGTLIMARNCHKSVYHTLELRDIMPVYIYPEIIDGMWINGVIMPSDVEKLLEKNPDAKAVIITSPTYEGVVSDISSIAEIVHRFGSMLIVDEAHGAHFNYSDKFPRSAVECGADIVIQSLHKTLPSYTQTALLHVCSDRVNADKIRKYLGIYQTSSPSYIFMAGMEKCIDYMSGEGKKRLEEYYVRLLELRNNLSSVSGIRLLEKSDDMYDYDVSKLVVSSCGRMTGNGMSEILRNSFNVEPEMTADDYVIMMTSLCDDFRWYDTVWKAVSHIGKLVENRDEIIVHSVHKQESHIVFKPSEASGMSNEPVNIKECRGCVSAETAYVYPPGIPVLMPGELITDGIYDILLNHKLCNLKIKGIKDKNGEVIQCIK